MIKYIILKISSIIYTVEKHRIKVNW